MTSNEKVKEHKRHRCTEKVKKKKDKKKRRREEEELIQSNNDDTNTKREKNVKQKKDEISLQSVVHSSDDDDDRKKVKTSSSDDDHEDDDKSKKAKKKKKKKRKEEKKEKKEKEKINGDTSLTIEQQQKTVKAKNIKAAPNKDDIEIVGGRIVSFSADALEPKTTTGASDATAITLLLFYQYIEPVLDNQQFQSLLHHVETIGESFSITGRMRVSIEGLNCTLTGSYDNIRLWCKALRSYDTYFTETEFKLTDHLPKGQAFPRLHAFKVDEIVNYGLTGVKAPSINMSGVHLEPKEYHEKMQEEDTVIIDVRNHYEAAIGKFMPPDGGAKYIDPMMRKSTEFPLWLDRPETKEMLRGKQVLMYCTGGVRCERASALLKTKIENEEDTKELGIKGVYQLQGGIDKYFRDFPEGGWWRGKNYVFDKRFSHAPPVQENLDRVLRQQQKEGDDNTTLLSKETIPVEAMGKCEACRKPWDKYRGKRRCPTCGVPSLICKECYDLDVQKIKKLNKSIRCDLCVEEGITHKSEIRERELKEMEAYEMKLRDIYGFDIVSNNTKKRKGRSSNNTSLQKNVTLPPPNNKPCTRLFIKNLCAKQIDQNELVDLIPQITHIEWITDRITKNWYGSVFVEVSTVQDATNAITKLHGNKISGRVLTAFYCSPDPKSIWPHYSLKI